MLAGQLGGLNTGVLSAKALWRADAMCSAGARHDDDFGRMGGRPDFRVGDAEILDEEDAR
jgi:hypothetical protein